MTSPNDVACDVTLKRLDKIWWYSANNITSAIKTQADFENHQANAAHGYALVVNSLKWCGGAGGPWDGCGWPAGGKKPFVVTYNVIANRPEIGIVLAHEFGHTVGLDHEANPATYPLQIMDGGVLTINNTKIKNSAVCSAFQYSFLALGCPAPNTNSISAPAICSNPGAPSFTAPTLYGPLQTAAEVAPIEDIAKGLIVDHMPVELADVYSENDVKKLIGLLSTPSEELHHKTIATLIGL